MFRVKEARKELVQDLESSKSTLVQVARWGMMAEGRSF
jgi:hypothetical protein